MKKKAIRTTKLRSTCYDSTTAITIRATGTAKSEEYAFATTRTTKRQGWDTNCWSQNIGPLGWDAEQWGSDVVDREHRNLRCVNGRKKKSRVWIQLG